MAAQRKVYSLAKMTKRLILIPDGEHIVLFPIVTAMFIANRWWTLSLRVESAELTHDR